MATPILGSLTSVNPREAWNHEAYSFTPWLAEHLDLLSDEIGIPLELEGQEGVRTRFISENRRAICPGWVLQRRATQWCKQFKLKRLLCDR